MARLLRTCRAVLRDEKRRPDVVRALAKTSALLRAHLDDEEKALFPFLREDAAWGPVRVEALAREHLAQRQTLVAIGCDATDVNRPIAMIAEEIVWFVRGLARDMEREEKGIGARREIAVVDRLAG
jgi:hypothetical protein